VKREDLLRRLREAGCILIRHGGKHDWYTNPRTGMSQPVPRHTQINETLAKHISEKARQLIVDCPSLPMASRHQARRHTV
jgi:hypothetical protein